MKPDTKFPIVKTVPLSFELNEARIAVDFSSKITHFNKWINVKAVLDRLPSILSVVNICLFFLEKEESLGYTNAKKNRWQTQWTISMAATIFIRPWSPDIDFNFHVSFLSLCIFFFVLLLFNSKITSICLVCAFGLSFSLDPHQITLSVHHFNSVFSLSLL